MGYEGKNGFFASRRILVVLDAVSFGFEILSKTKE